MLDFEPVEGCRYLYNYERIFSDIAKGKLDLVQTFRTLILEDLWFLVYTVFEIPAANHPFVVKSCRDVQFGPKDYTLDLWGREHFKSTIITKGETIQEVLRNPEERIGIFSHTRSNAKGFLRPIKSVFETSLLLKKCFPDILYEKPESEAPKWSEDDGIIVKRKGNYTESTVEAWGLIEGMPTSRHYTKRKYDDIMTQDYVNSPDQMMELSDKFDHSQNLGTDGGTHRVIGTPYHYNDVYAQLRKKKNHLGKSAYHIRLKPSTDNGQINGKPVLISQARLDNLKQDLKVFNSQHLLDPSPVGVRALDSSYLDYIPAHKIPKDLYKFLIIDPAGDDKKGTGDSWAIVVYGISPFRDDLGASDIYVLDGLVAPLREESAPEDICRIYRRNGLIMQVGVEKVALSTAEIHVKNALQKEGIYLSLEEQTLVVLRPGGLDNVKRIERIIPWSLYNRKIHISEALPDALKMRIQTEMDQFPFWHDDFLTTLAYVYPMIKDYNFPYIEEEEDEDQNVIPISRNAVTGY